MSTKIDDGKGIWRTVSGRRVYIEKGQSLHEAMAKSGKFKNLKNADKISKMKSSSNNVRKKGKTLDEKIQERKDLIDKFVKKYPNWEDGEYNTDEYDNIAETLGISRDDVYNEIYDRIYEKDHEVGGRSYEELKQDYEREQLIDEINEDRKAEGIPPKDKYILEEELAKNGYVMSNGREYRLKGPDSPEVKAINEKVDKEFGTAEKQKQYDADRKWMNKVHENENSNPSLNETLSSKETSRDDKIKAFAEKYGITEEQARKISDDFAQISGGVKESSVQPKESTGIEYTRAENGGYLVKNGNENQYYNTIDEMKADWGDNVYPKERKTYSLSDEVQKKYGESPNELKQEYESKYGDDDSKWYDYTKQKEENNKSFKERVLSQKPSEVDENGNTKFDPNDTAEEQFIKLYNTRYNQRMKDAESGDEKAKDLAKRSENWLDRTQILEKNDDFLLYGTQDEEIPDYINYGIFEKYNGDKQRGNISIEYNDWNYSGTKPNHSAQVNWSAIGSTSVEDTEKFTKRLHSAIDLAKKINGKDYSDRFKAGANKTTPVSEDRQGLSDNDWEEYQAEKNSPESYDNTYGMSPKEWKKEYDAYNQKLEEIDKEHKQKQEAINSQEWSSEINRSNALKEAHTEWQKKYNRVLAERYPDMMKEAIEGHMYDPEVEKEIKKGIAHSKFNKANKSATSNLKTDKLGITTDEHGEVIDKNGNKTGVYSTYEPDFTYGNKSTATAKANAITEVKNAKSQKEILEARAKAESLAGKVGTDKFDNKFAKEFDEAQNNRTKELAKPTAKTKSLSDRVRKSKQNKSTNTWTKEDEADLKHAQEEYSKYAKHLNYVNNSETRDNFEKWHEEVRRLQEKYANTKALSDKIRSQRAKRKGTKVPF